MKLPITFKEYAKDPVKAVSFLALVAIMYLYVDNKMVYKEQIKKQEERVIILEDKVEKLQNKLIEISQKI